MLKAGQADTWVRKHNFKFRCWTHRTDYVVCRSFMLEFYIYSRYVADQWSIMLCLIYKDTLGKGKPSINRDHFWDCECPVQKHPGESEKFCLLLLIFGSSKDLDLSLTILFSYSRQAFEFWMRTGLILHCELKTIWVEAYVDHSERWAPAPCDPRVLGAVGGFRLVGRRPADCREWLLLAPTVGQTTEADLASPGSSSGRELLPAQLPEETIVGQNIFACKTSAN